MSLQVGEKFLPLFEPPGRFEHFAFHGGRGGAKSHSIALALAIHSGQRQERIVCGRQFQNSIKDSVKELIEAKIKELNMAVYFTCLEREIINNVTGSRFSFIGMDRNPDSAKSLEGATIFWGEEAQTFTRRSIEIIIPTIRDSRSRMIWSWNPRERADEVDVMFRGPVPPEKAYVAEVSWRDNPFFYRTRMPSEYRRSMRRNPKRHLHIWEGGYDENPDAAVFDNWATGRPLIDLSKHRPRFGMDFGYSQDPYALIKCYLLEEIDTIYIAQEAVGYKIPNRGLSAFCDQVTESRDYQIIGDSSRPETIEALQSEGFMVYGSRKGAGSVKNGINWLQGYRLLIDPSCLTVQEEIRSYKWKEDPNGKPLPIVEDHQQDHTIDAIRYAFEDDSTSAVSEDDDGVSYV